MTFCSFVTNKMSFRTNRESPTLVGPFNGLEKIARGQVAESSTNPELKVMDDICSAGRDRNNMAVLEEISALL